MATTKKKASDSHAEPETKGATATPAATVKPRNIAAYEAAVAEFQLASELFAKKQFAEAKSLFDSVAATATADEPILADRSRTYASICARQTASPVAGGDDAESLYHRGVLATNAGRLDEAWSLLDKATALRPSDGSIFYARASVRGLQGNVEGAASELKKALAIDPTFRFQAASDSDFDRVRDEAAFIDVIEPSHAGA
jgi:tetratricopeptide (TPR) repeat protein